MGRNKEHYEQVKEAVGEEVYREVFAPIRSRYGHKFVRLWLEYAEKERELSGHEFGEIMSALDTLQITD